MSHLSGIQRQLIAWDYDVLLPFLARLPLSWGRRLAVWRGILYAWLQRDWRQFSFQDKDLHERTCLAMRWLLPGADAIRLRQAVSQCYQMRSIDEWEAACLILGRDISQWPVIYEGLEEVLALLDAKPALILLSAHFSSSILGGAMLQRLGVPILGMSSNIIEDPRVPPSIGRFYSQKNAAIGRYLNGGRLLHREGNIRQFVSFLRRGGAVVIFGDLPPAPHETPTVRPFFGETRGFAPGPVKLSKLANVPIVAFVCEFYGGSYHLRFSAPQQEPYAFIEQAIQRAPGTWGAADLLPLLPVLPDTP